MTTPAYDPPTVERAGMLVDVETLKVIHAQLHGLGWYRSWGFPQYQKFMQDLDAFFGDKPEHLTRR